MHEVDGLAVATFHWIGGTALGTAKVRGKLDHHMGELVIVNGYPNGCRAFYSRGPDEIKSVYRWKRVDGGGYDLIHSSGATIGMFRMQRETTPIGEIYATLYYNFSCDELFVDSILSLCLNRWLDGMGRRI